MEGLNFIWVNKCGGGVVAERNSVQRQVITSRRMAQGKGVNQGINYLWLASSYWNAYYSYKNIAVHDKFAAYPLGLHFVISQGDDARDKLIPQSG